MKTIETPTYCITNCEHYSPRTDGFRNCDAANLSAGLLRLSLTQHEAFIEATETVPQMGAVYASMQGAVIAHELDERTRNSDLALIEDTMNQCAQQQIESGPFGRSYMSGVPNPEDALTLILPPFGREERQAIRTLNEAVVAIRGAADISRQQRSETE